MSTHALRRLLSHTPSWFSKTAVFAVAFAMVVIPLATEALDMAQAPQVLDAITYPAITLTSPTNESLLLKVVPVSFDGTNWKYQITWVRTRNAQGSVYVTLKADLTKTQKLFSSDPAAKTDNGTQVMTLAPSTGYRVEFYQQPSAGGVLLLRKFFTTLPTTGVSGGTSSGTSGDTSNTTLITSLPAAAGAGPDALGNIQGCAPRWTLSADGKTCVPMTDCPAGYVAGTQTAEAGATTVSCVLAARTCPPGTTDMSSKRSTIAAMVTNDGLICKTPGFTSQNLCPAGWKFSYAQANTSADSGYMCLSPSQTPVKIWLAGKPPVNTVPCTVTYVNGPTPDLATPNITCNHNTSPMVCTDYTNTKFVACPAGFTLKGPPFLNYSTGAGADPSSYFALSSQSCVSASGAVNPFTTSNSLTCAMVDGATVAENIVCTDSEQHPKPCPITWKIATNYRTPTDLASQIGQYSGTGIAGYQKNCAPMLNDGHTPIATYDRCAQQFGIVVPVCESLMGGTAGQGIANDAYVKCLYDHGGGPPVGTNCEQYRTNGQTNTTYFACIDTEVGAAFARMAGTQLNYNLTQGTSGENASSFIHAGDTLQIGIAPYTSEIYPVKFTDTATWTMKLGNGTVLSSNPAPITSCGTGAALGYQCRTYFYPVLPSNLQPGNYTITLFGPSNQQMTLLSFNVVVSTNRDPNANACLAGQLRQTINDNPQHQAFIAADNAGGCGEYVSDHAVTFTALGPASGNSDGSANITISWQIPTDPILAKQKVAIMICSSPNNCSSTGIGNTINDTGSYGSPVFTTISDTSVPISAGSAIWKYLPSDWPMGGPSGLLHLKMLIYSAPTTEARTSLQAQVGYDDAGRTWPVFTTNTTGLPVVEGSCDIHSVTSTSITSNWKVSAGTYDTLVLRAGTNQGDVDTGCAGGTCVVKEDALSLSTTSYTKTNLQPGTTYHFRVAAVNTHVTPKIFSEAKWDCTTLPNSASGVNPN